MSWRRKLLFTRELLFTGGVGTRSSPPVNRSDCSVSTIPSAPLRHQISAPHPFDGFKRHLRSRSGRPVPANLFAPQHIPTRSSATQMTKAQIDRLGERLRKGMVAETDLRLLDQYRRSFADAYDVVVEIVRDRLAQQPTGRPAKSTTSIVDKLKRESIRLSQMQDIAGCRLVVADVLAQQRVVDDLSHSFDKIAVVDRRKYPSHGYRAVHVIVSVEGKPIEIQVRTTLQHLWSELSEKFSDLVDPAIKYGGGDDAIRTVLAGTSKTISDAEGLEERIAAEEAGLAEQHDKARDIRETARSTLVRIADASLTTEQLTAKEKLEQSEKNTAALELQIATAQEAVSAQKEGVKKLTQDVGRMLQEAIAMLPARKGENGAVLD